MKSHFIALGAVSLLIASSAYADMPTVPACNRTVTGASTPSQLRDNHLCYGTLYAQGRYAEVLDRAQLISSNSRADDAYFVGASYLGLSTREAAETLKCLYVNRARQYLTSFLEQSRAGYASNGSFGTNEDMAQVEAAAKMLDAARSVAGCETASYTPSELTEYAVRYGRDRARNMMFGTGAKDPVTTAAQASMQTLNATLSDAVSAVSNLEGVAAMTNAELTSDQDILNRTAARLQSQLGALSAGTLVVFSNDPNVGTFPQSVNATELASVSAALDTKLQFVTEMKQFVAGQEQALLRATAATDKQAYVVQLASDMQTIRDKRAAVDDARTKWTSMVSPAVLAAADHPKTPTTLTNAAAAVTSLWTGKSSTPQSWCRTSDPQWYCKGGM